MNERADPFAENLPVFAVKLRTDRPIAKEAIDKIAEDHNFPSREAKKAPSTPKRKPRVYRTGRSLNFSLKATVETRDRFHKAADAHGVTLARLLELALDALEKQGPSVNS